MGSKILLTSCSKLWPGLLTSTYGTKAFESSMIEKQGFIEDKQISLFLEHGLHYIQAMLKKVY